MNETPGGLPSGGQGMDIRKITDELSVAPQILGERRALALLFKQLATLRTDAPLFADVDELRWRGPTDSFTACAERLGDPRLLARAHKAAATRR